VDALVVEKTGTEVAVTDLGLRFLEERRQNA
jgi:hypothetical protein